ncbi:MAG: PEFG-CTERM sorting domain-containing protein [Candidatus Nitrosotenuis sp.]
MNKTVVALVAILFAASFSFVYAEDEKLAFAGYIEESLGHFWAIERNLDDDNAKLALIHATHPIAELYTSMKPELKEANPEFDAKVQQTLMDLGKKTGEKVTREDAQKAIDEAKSILEQARSIVVGDELSNDTNFQAKLMAGLLKTSVGEYGEGVKAGKIELMAEFQDGSSFVWRSQQIFDKIKSDLPEDQRGQIEKGYADLLQAYKDHADPSEIETIVDGIIHELEEVTGEQSETGLGKYFDNISDLLGNAREEYSEGNTDKAMGDATKAYLDNYEFLEAPIAKQDKDLMKKIEISMREELRDLIKKGASTDDVDSKISQILNNLKQAKSMIPQDELGENTMVKENDIVIAPLKQVTSGVEPKDVNCGEYLELVIKKSTGTPACVKSETAEKLVKLGWGTRQ